MEDLRMANKSWLACAFLGMAFTTATHLNGKTDDSSTINGVNRNTLKSLSDSLKKDSKAGKATFYSDTKWLDGMRSSTTFSRYTIDGKSKGGNIRSFVLQGDEMSELGGTDSVPGAVEEMMYAVGTCIVAAANANAVMQGVKLTKIEVSLESDIDIHGLMGLDPKVRPGVLDFRTSITIAGDSDEATLKKIAMSGYKFSPVSDTVQHGVTKAEPPKIIVIKEDKNKQASHSN
jgi:uncharacterized OsmC-like protein